MRSFEAAVALKPRSARALFHLGNAQFALQLYTGADMSFTSALKASTHVFNRTSCERHAQAQRRSFTAICNSVAMCMQEIRLPAEERLLPKVHVNLGITLEADGCLSAACEHYRYVPAIRPFWLLEPLAQEQARGHLLSRGDDSNIQIRGCSVFFDTANPKRRP